MPSSAVRYMPPNSKLFHPNVYIFTNEANEQTAIIGSHNLTHSAFSGHNNTEASVLIKGTSKERLETLEKALSLFQSYTSLADMPKD